MRLYTRTGAVSVTDPDTGRTHEADADGGFNFDEDFGSRLLGFHAGGKPMWETEVGRQQRIVEEELARRRDPATLAELVEKLTRRAEQASEPQPEPEPDEPEPSEPGPKAEQPKPAPEPKPAPRRTSKRASSAPTE